MVEAGKVCNKFHSDKVRDVNIKRIQCDKIWSLVYAKQKKVPNGKEEAAGSISAIIEAAVIILSWVSINTKDDFKMIGIGTIIGVGFLSF